MAKEEILQKIARRLRIHSVQMTTRAGSGHPTSCLSMAEIMACVFFDEMKINVKDPDDVGNDEFVLSKGHASPILWAAFAEAGIIPLKKLEGYRQYPSPIEGHPTPNMPWVKAATGSLGQGLSVGLGMAEAIKLLKSPARVFVLLGDGECAEGSVWEAAEIAAKRSVSNIVAIVDVNRLAQSDPALHGHEMKKWEGKWKAFGWNTAVIDGHSVKEVLDALDKAKSAKGPFVILAKTFKGKGVSFLEDKPGKHGKPVPDDMLDNALEELGPMPEVDAKKLVKAREVKKPSPKTKAPEGPSYAKGDMVATRVAYGKMLEKLGVNERVVALDGDVKNSTYSEYFKKAYPERFVDCFIAEQNMVGMAAGFAAKGFVPFASSFAAFMSRAHDQIRMSAISRHNLKLVGSHVGVSIGEDGPSQMGLEDLSLFRCLPESVVLYPCDAVSSERCTELLAGHEGIGFLRTSRPKAPVVYANHEKFAIGGSKVLKKGDKVVIVAAGVTVHEALKAAEKVDGVGVIDAYSVKPLDVKAIKKEAEGREVVVVEDHYPEGGLGEAVASLGIPITHLAVRDIPRSGSPEDLMCAYGIDASAIERVVKKLI